MNASARHREQPVDLHLEHPGCGANSARAGLLSLACGSSWLFFLLFFFFFFKVISEDGRLPTISATRLRPACSARWRNGWRFSASSAVLLEVDVGEGELEVSSLEGSDFVAVGRCAAAHWHSGSSEGSGGTTEGRSLLRFPVMIFLSFNRRFEGDEDIGFTMKFWVGDNRNLRQAFPATQAPHARMSFGESVAPSTSLYLGCCGQAALWHCPRSEAMSVAPLNVRRRVEMEQVRYHSPREFTTAR